MDKGALKVTVRLITDETTAQVSVLIMLFLKNEPYTKKINVRSCGVCASRDYFRDPTYKIL